MVNNVIFFDGVNIGLSTATGIPVAWMRQSAHCLMRDISCSLDEEGSLHPLERG